MKMKKKTIKQLECELEYMTCEFWKEILTESNGKKDRIEFCSFMQATCNCDGERDCCTFNLFDSSY